MLISSWATASSFLCSERLEAHFAESKSFRTMRAVRLLCSRKKTQSERVSTNRKVSARVSQPPAPPPPALAGPEILCNICARSGAETEIPVEKLTPRCAHVRTICKECIERHIAQSIEKQFYEIRCVCVEQGCSQTLTAQDVQKHASTRLFTRYDDGLLRSTLEKDPEFCWCARPGCGSGQLHATKNRAQIVTCHVCSFKTCFQHHCEWHSGRTCRQYDTDASNSEEVGLLQFLQDTKRFRQCPNCQQGVEKNDGCDHMTCRCKHEFCWRCLAPYRGSHGIFEVGNCAHERSCTHYRK